MLLVADFSNQLEIVFVLEVGNVIIDLLELFDPCFDSWNLDGDHVVSTHGEDFDDNFSSGGGNGGGSSASTSSGRSQKFHELVTHLRSQFGLLAHDESLSEECDCLVVGDVGRSDLCHRLECLNRREDAALAFAGQGQIGRMESKVEAERKEPKAVN